ncbi:uncharacterized protein DS421_11g344210 [Arachis hypogaea]|nr:uncharacterized protein DS421_11g344210 [Arachis hypogaea]
MVETQADDVFFMFSLSISCSIPIGSKKTRKSAFRSLFLVQLLAAAKEIDGGVTTENDFLGYLAIMIFCKSEDSYRVDCPASQRTFAMGIANRKALPGQRTPGNVGSSYLYLLSIASLYSAIYLLNNLELMNLTNNPNPTKNSQVLTPSLPSLSDGSMSTLS